jgi:UDP-N-acetylmuramate dehydrogenase
VEGSERLMKEWQRKAESELEGIRISPDYPMAKLTTFKVGGPVDLLAEPENIAQLQAVLQFCLAEGIPWMILGLGSNLIVRDKGIRGVVVKLGGEFIRWEVTGQQVTAGAAVSLAELAKATAQMGLSGLEFACGIPGSVGGAVYMNAGAYDGEIAGVLAEVMAWDPLAGIVTYRNSEIGFGYRRSRFQTDNKVILKLVLELKTDTAGEACAKVADFTTRRESKQPLELPSAGSVFKRPEGYYVGPLIEQAGLKGYQIGGAQVSLKHAGFIVNAGGATARDVLDLIEHVRKVIREKYEVNLVPEIKVVGEE